MTESTGPAFDDAPFDPEPEALAVSFLERCRRGESPSVAEYAARSPALAERIERLFPALLLLERAGPGGSSGGGAPRNLGKELGFVR